MALASELILDQDADHRARRHRRPIRAAGGNSSRLGMSMLFITHDLGIVRRIADVVCVMNSGKIVEQGPSAGLYCAETCLCARAAAGEAIPPPRPMPVVMSTDNLKSGRSRGLLRKTVGHIKAVDGVSLAVRKGETLGVVGESGSGKTTLGLALLRLISSDGPIVFLGSNIQGLRFKEMLPFRRDMQIVFQDPFGALSPRMSVGDIVAEGLSVHQRALSEQEREARVVKASRFSIRTRFRYPHEFSMASASVSRSRAPVLAEFRRAGRADKRARHAVPGADGRPLRELRASAT
jgi:microcin C transport system ATP-binding protein